MKQCSVCQEEFADKFTFCPIDGTPLAAFSARPEASASLNEETVPSMPATDEDFSLHELSAAHESFTASRDDEADDATQNAGAFGAAAAAGAGAAAAASGRGEFHLTIIEDAGITRRLAQQLSAVKHQSQLTWPEFKRDPAGFTRRMASGYGSS
ncbi:MAG: hypothetical protein QOF02_1311, partial [Blastocatellia bacterium]|nr:hypothetical protein [Blastocatellia bacterium]